MRVIHTVCGGTAFFYDGPLTPGERCNPTKATLLNGQHPASGDRMICGSCNQPIGVVNNALEELVPGPN